MATGARGRGQDRPAIDDEVWLGGLALLLASASDAVYCEDSGGRITHWNRSAERLFGRSADAVMGMLSAGLYPEHRQDERAFLSRRVDAGEVVEGYETEIRRHDGLVVPVELTACPIKGAGRTAVGAWVPVRDVTEQKVAEATLADWASRIDEAEELAHVGLWLWDQASGSVQMSRGLHRILGVDPHDFDGTLETYIGFSPPEDAAPLAAAMQEAYETSASFEREYRVVRRGPPHWVYARGEPVLNAVGSTVGLRGVVQDVTERKQSEAALLEHTAQMSEQATHDALTGLPNRSLFLRRLGDALARSAGTDEQVAVLFVDLDGFKLVNDSLGHAVGDSVLVALAGRIRSVLRPTDTVARFGGDEFTIVCESLPNEDYVLGIVERVGQAVSVPLRLDDGVEVSITTSIGIAFATGAEDNPEELLRDADVAMYRAKAQGRARATVFDAAMHTQAAERLETVSRLRGAADRGELRLYYQPQVSLDRSEVVGVEALIRWEHPERGLVLPDQFIPLAEEAQLIGPIGRWVLEEACRQAVEWQRQRPGLAPLKMAVNVSASQLTQGDMVTTTARILRDTGMDPASLCLEITEGVLMGDADGSLGALRGLKELGVTVAVDDFGMGYSSLAYLQDFPVDILKVDRAFVARLDPSLPQRKALVAVVIDLAHALGQIAIAEGVETVEQLDDLISLGCDIGQGYLFGRPQAAGIWAP